MSQLGYFCQNQSKPNCSWQIQNIVKEKQNNSKEQNKLMSVIKQKALTYATAEGAGVCCRHCSPSSNAWCCSS